ncbi:MAG TPA: ABC transporter permease [Vicinamibacterales bacterium]|nr:ABC transporter permease [Vicinamibacterales bacterium]
MFSHALIELTKARFKEFLREPEAMFWSFAFPVIMTCALGVAFQSDGNEPVIVGVAQGLDSARLTGALTAAGNFTVRDIPPEEIERAVRDGRAPVVVVGGNPPVYHFDEARAESQAARLAVDAALQRAAGRADAFTATERPVDRVGSRYIDWLVPGLLGMGIMSTGLWSVSFSIVTSRTRKLLKRLVATPMSRGDYLLAHVLSRLVFLALESIVLIGFSTVVFGVVVRGSMVTLGVVAITGALSFGGLALLVSSRVRTIEAVSGLLNLVMLPMWVLSGVFFASTNFPDAMQPVIQTLPLTALIDALRGVVNEGRSLAAVAPDLGLLSLWGSVSFALALKLFRWQ